MAKLPAFTLIEILTVLAIFLGLSILVIPYTIQSLQTERARALATDMTNAISRLQQDAFAARDQSGYGIALFADRYITYTGNDLASSSASDTFQLERNLSITNISLQSGVTEINFLPGVLTSPDYGSFTVSDGAESFQVIINRQGLVYHTRL